MEISVVRNQSGESWSENLDNYRFSLFIIPAWVESLQDNSMKPLYLDFVSEDEMVAKIAGFSIDSKLFWQKKLFFYAGPAIRKDLPETNADTCIMALLNYAKRNKYPRVVILSYDYGYVLPFRKDLGFSERMEFVIDLLQDKEEISKNISRSVKRDIHKSADEGFVLKSSRSDVMTEHLIRLMKETKRIRLLKGYSNYNYFYLPGFTKGALDNLIKKGVINIYYIEKDSKIFAVQTILEYNHKAYALFIGVDAEGYKHGIPSFVDVSVMTRLKENNFEYLNMGGVPTDATHLGIAEFKRKLGAKEQYSSYGSTNFLTFPSLLLNPLIRRIRNLKSNPIVDSIKSMLKV